MTSSDLAWHAEDMRDEQSRRRMMGMLGDARRVLDISIGGGQVPGNPERMVRFGIDLDRIRQGREWGHEAAVELPYPSEDFDAVTCERAIEYLKPAEAITLVQEVARILRPGGVAVFAALNWTPAFFRTDGHMRPYPPDALRECFDPRSPLVEERLWLRRPALVRSRYASLQYRLGLRRWWTYDAYLLSFRKPAQATNP